MNKNRRIKVVITLIVFVCLCIGIYKMSGVVVKNSYSASDVLSKSDSNVFEVNSKGVIEDSLVSDSESYVVLETDDENVKSVQDYNTKFNATLVPVDYSNRETKFDRVETERYKQQIEKYKKLGAENPESQYVVLKSLYYGDYSTYYDKDESTFFKNYPDFLSFLDELKKYTSEFNAFSESCSGDVPDRITNKYDIYWHKGLDFNNLGKCNTYNDVLMLVGVIDDRYYVYIDNMTNITSCENILVVDSKEEIISKPFPLSRRLGDYISTLSIYSEASKFFSIGGKKVLYAKGY